MADGYGPDRTVDNQSFRPHVKFLLPVIPILRRLSTVGPHDGLRLEGAVFVSRFKIAAPSRLFHITADWYSFSLSAFHNPCSPFCPFPLVRTLFGRSSLGKRVERAEGALCLDIVAASALSGPGNENGRGPTALVRPDRDNRRSSRSGAKGERRERSGWALLFLSGCDRGRASAGGGSLSRSLWK